MNFNQINFAVKIKLLNFHVRRRYDLKNMSIFDFKSRDIMAESYDLKSDFVVDTTSLQERKFLVELKEFINQGNKNFCALIGPRKVGKTIALMQLANLLQERNEIIYYDFKQHGNDANEAFLVEMENCFDKEIVFLLDEITYLEDVDINLARIAQRAKGACQKFKVIFTGSQPQAIRAWMRRYFSSDAFIVYCSFLGYDEWLQFHESSISYESYVDYVQHSSDFFKITDNREYLAGCIEETLMSAAKSCNVIRELEDIDEDDVFNVIAFLYTALIKLHNGWKWESFLDINKAVNSICGGFRGSRSLLTTNIKEEMKNHLIANYNSFKKVSLDKLRVYLRFLARCDFIVFTVNCSTDVIGKETFETRFKEWLWKGDNGLFDSPVTFFKQVTVCFKYPLFYYNLVSDLVAGLGFQAEDFLDGNVLGSILECNVRGLYSYVRKTNIIPEYQTDTAEIDIVDDVHQKAIEITISNKNLNRVHFKVLDDIEKFRDYSRILLTKDLQGQRNGITFIPFYEYVHQLSKEAVIPVL